jgi:hypothetical protein
VEISTLTSTYAAVISVCLSAVKLQSGQRIVGTVSAGAAPSQHTTIGQGTSKNHRSKFIRRQATQKYICTAHAFFTLSASSYLPSSLLRTSNNLSINQQRRLVGKVLDIAHDGGHGIGLQGFAAGFLGLPGEDGFDAVLGV